MMRFDPSLAEAVGLNQAIFISQLDYWMARSKYTKNGKPWVYNTVRSWQKILVFWSVGTVGRVIKGLVDEGVVETHDHGGKTYYSINYSLVPVDCWGGLKCAPKRQQDKPEEASQDETSLSQDETNASHNETDLSQDRTNVSQNGTPLYKEAKTTHRLPDTTAEGGSHARPAPPPQRVDASPTHYGQPRRDYKYRAASKPAENTAAARELGIQPPMFREMVDLVLKITGKKALADCDGDAADQVLYDAQGCALNLARMGYPTPDAIRTVHGSWQENDWRGKTAPTFKQFQEHASAMNAGTHCNKFEFTKDRNHADRWQRSQESSPEPEPAVSAEDDAYYREFFKQRAAARAAEAS